MAPATAPTLAPSSVKIDLSRVAMISVSFHNGIGNMKKVKVKVVTDADASLLRHQKKLLESPELDAIRSADGAIRRWLELKTTPSISEGTYTLPHGLLPEVIERLDTYINNERPVLVGAFMNVYDAQVAHAAFALGEHFRANDYASRAEVEAGFWCDYQFVSVEVPSDLKNVDSKAFAKAVEKQQKKLEEAASEIRTALRVAVSEMVTHLATVLTPSADGRRKKLYDTTVTNLAEFLSTFSLRNVTDDSQLQVEVEKLRCIMNGVTVEKLRESEGLKDTLLAKVAAVAPTLNQLVTDAPARRFR